MEGIVNGFVFLIFFSFRWLALMVITEWPVKALCVYCVPTKTAWWPCLKLLFTILCWTGDWLIVRFRYTCMVFESLTQVPFPHLLLCNSFCSVLFCSMNLSNIAFAVKGFRGWKTISWEGSILYVLIRSHRKSITFVMEYRRDPSFGPCCSLSTLMN